jgi:hypothetical protein
MAVQTGLGTYTMMMCICMAAFSSLTLLGSHCMQGSEPYNKATLVVCPVVAVIQWRDEILKFTEPGTLKVRGSLMCSRCCSVF